jgi:hypothetical protein
MGLSADEFRRLALAMPGATEHSHQKRPDFRVGKRIFATLGYPDANFAMVKLTPDQQARLASAAPAMVSPAAGAWGAKGSTLVSLGHADEATAASALALAWENATGKP